MLLLVANVTSAQTISSINPECATVGTGFRITVNGSGFNTSGSNAAVILINGTATDRVSVSSNQVVADIPGSVISSIGNYDVVVRQTQGQQVQTSNTFILRVIGAPTAVSTPAATRCGPGQVTLTVSGAPAGAAYRWYSVETGGNAISGATGATYSPSITANTSYWVSMTAPGGCESARTRVEAVVNPIPTAPTVSTATPTSRCGTGTVTITMSGAPANGSYRWYTSPNATTPIDGATTATLTTPSIAAGSSLTYYVSTRSAAGCESTRTAVTATANAIPAAPAAQDRERCGPGTVTLEVSSPNPSLTYRWYTSTGILQATGVSFTTPTLTSSTTYYLAAVGAGNCESATRTAVTAGVRPAPVANILSETPQCDNPGGNNVFGLDGTVENGNHVWEIVSGGNIATISNTDTFSPQVTVSQPGTVTVRLTVTSLAPGCEPAVDEIELVVNELPEAVATTNVRGGEVCGSGRVTLSIIEPAANITYRWYEAATGGTSLGEGATFTTGVLTASDVFYVAAVNSAGCESDPRVAVSATVNPLPQASIAAETPQCENTDGPTLFALTGTIANGTFVWEIIEGADRATLVNATSTTPTVSVSEPGTVRVRLTVSSTNCGDATAEVALVVNQVPDALTDANVEDVRRCGPGSVTLVASGAPEGVSYRWYTAPTGGSLVFTGASFATPNLTASRTYYVAAYIPATATTGCESDSRVPITAVIEAVPVATISTETPQCDNPGGNNVFGITGTAENGTFTWAIVSGSEIATISGENTLAPQVTVTQPGTVRIQLTVANEGSSCSPDVEVLDLVVTPLPEPLTAANVNGAERCGPGNVTLTASGAPAGVSYRWYAASSGGQVLDSDGSFTVSVNQTTTYYVAAVSNNCESTSRVAVVATVNPLPIISAGADQRVCPDGTTTNFTLAGSISPEGAPAAATDGIVWSVVSGTATITANTDPLRPSVAVTGSAATIRLTVRSEEGCVVTDDVVLMENPLPTATAGTYAAQCVGANNTTTFTLSNGSITNGTPTWSIGTTTGGATATIVSGANTMAPEVRVTGTGTVSVTLTANSNTNPACGTATSTTVLTVNPLPLANAGTDEAKCVTGTATAFTLNGTATNGTGRWSVLSSTGGATASISNVNQLNTGVSVSGTGTVTLRLTTTSTESPACGTATDDVILTVNPLPTATAGTYAAQCVGANNTTTFTLSNGSITNGTPTWSIGTTTGGATATIVSGANTMAPEVRVTGTGTVSVTLTANSNTNPACGTATSTTVLTVNPLPVLSNFTNKTACQSFVNGALAPTTVALGGSVTGGTGSWTVLNQASTITGVTFSDQVSPSSNVTVTGYGVVSLRYSATGPQPTSCPASRDITVTVNPTPVLSSTLSPAAVCSGSLFTYTPTSTPSGASFTWSRAAVTGISNTARTNVSGGISETLTNTTANPIVVTYVYTSTLATCSSTQSVRVTVNPRPVVNAGTSITSCQNIVNGLPAPTTLALNGSISVGSGAWTVVDQPATVTGVTFSNVNSPTSNVTITGYGSVRLRLASTATDNCSTPSDVTINITQRRKLTLVLEADPFPVCPGQNTRYKATVYEDAVVVWNTDRRDSVDVISFRRDVSDQFTFDWWKNDRVDNQGGRTGRVVNQAGLSSTDYYTVRATYTGSSLTCNYFEKTFSEGLTGADLYSNRIYLGYPEGYGVQVSADPGNVICAGTSVTFTATANATYANPVYQWQVNGQNVAGQTTNVFTTSTLKNGDKVSVLFGSAETICGLQPVSNVITMTVNALPAITSQPASTAVCAGSTATFSVTATGTGITYQWYKRASDAPTSAGSPVTGSNVTGATTATLRIANATAADVGLYYVVVSGTCPPAVTSNNAQLNVTSVPAAYNVTGGGTYCAGGEGMPVGLASSQLNTTYQLVRRVGTTSTNVGSPIAGTGSAISFGNQTVAGTYSILATTVADQPNVAACPRGMNGDVTIVVNPVPLAVTATGGSYCATLPDGTASTGATVRLSNSQSDVSYQLVNASTSANAGSAAVGTGSAITLGPVLEGTYNVVATNTTTSCSSTVATNVVVTRTPGIQPVGDIVITNEAGAVITANQLETGQFARFTANTTFGDANASAVHKWEIGTGPESNPSDITWTVVDNVTGPILTIQDIPGGAFAVRVTVSGDPNICYNFYTATYSTEVAIPLPVELLYLRTFKQGNNVLVEWATASEENNAGFEVQVSENGLDFRKLAFVKTKNGNAMTKQVYQYVDKENGKHGTRYYRLKQIDESGTFEYFGVSVVTFGDVASLVKAFPNPFNTEITLDIAAEQQGNVQVMMYNAAGRKMMERTITVEKGFNTAVLEVNSDLPHGIYFVRVILNGQLYNLKLLKQ